MLPAESENDALTDGHSNAIFEWRVWGLETKRVLWQTVYTQMKCRIMRHFIRVCTVYQDKIELQRKKFNILGGIITCDPLIYIMDHHDFILCSFMENFTGLKRERNGSVVEGSSLTGVTALCPWARHINPSLVLVQPRETPPYITERLLMGCKESNQTNKSYLCPWMKPVPGDLVAVSLNRVSFEPVVFSPHILLPFELPSVLTVQTKLVH